MKLPKIYEPGQYETDIYALWEKTGAFTPVTSDTAYSIVMPPPNANANLHIGHALTVALEDIAVRYHRAKGEAALLLPGADHAGFETQSVYEKHLAKEGKSRFDFSREELYNQIWDFVALNRENFTNQMRAMGVGCDWTRFTFTLEDKVVSRAYSTFKKMWDEGLIYRGERLVNFCTFHGTAFADVEVVHREEPGHLWHIRYPLVDGSGELVVATTRPETMFGDVAVAVNPDDARYKPFVGKTVRLPLTNREVPIIADSFVDTTFGTGAVKITPAHDQNDFEAGQRHDLPKLTVISHEGKLIDVPEAYLGLTVEEGREVTVRDLEAQGFLVKTEEHLHNVGHCYKCDTVIQPLLREQWFVDMQPLAKRAIKVLQEGQITFYPEGKRDQLIRYLEGLRDWNISRQIAWGIPIPAFQNVDDPEDWIFNENVSEQVITQDGKTYHRDPDVFDTWFSSSSWPYATLDYPESDDFKQFYPLSLMETGGEILYPWVSRMIMLGLYVTDEIPFREVYIHGYVMASDGAKMSKSLGNVVDPLPVIEEFGSDALRMGIIASRTAAVNRGYDQRKVEDARNFCNKLWNIARYIEDLVGEEQGNAIVARSAADHWILHELGAAASVIGEHLDKYRFSEAYDTLYHFVWDDFADWYIEASKAGQNLPLLKHALESILIIAHPFAPFVTETIWQTLGWQGSEDEVSVLAVQQWPTVAASEKTKAKEFETVKAIVAESRFITRALRTTGTTLLYSDSKLLKENSSLIARLARLKAVSEGQGSSEGVALTSTTEHAWLDIDRDTARKYGEELQAKLEGQQKVVKQLEGRLSNKSYVDNAPEAVVQQTHDQLDDAKQQLSAIETEQKRFA
ncbi:MAG TPA: valine--tRNA ligase [Candidatus Microsaccharimonas sp.]|nr:valine--tRNA ligase [Candidatus Microsaccharimonas sp.]